jgi:hypothetical protein
MDAILVAANIAGRASSIIQDETLSGSNFVNGVKRSAKKANPRYRPFKLQDETEWFILLVDQRGFSDLAADPDIKTANDPDFRGVDGRYSDPLFLNTDLLFNGVLIRNMES